MPYGNQYTYEGTPNDANPYSYVYYPSYGWMWLAAPWVWGWGAYPYFSARGPMGFGWYAGLYRAGYGWGGYRGGGPGRVAAGASARGGVTRSAGESHAASVSHGSSGSISHGGFSGHAGEVHAVVRPTMVGDDVRGVARHEKAIETGNYRQQTLGQVHTPSSHIPRSEVRLE
jgi:hypothetical protein